MNKYSGNFGDCIVFFPAFFLRLVVVLLFMVSCTETTTTSSNIFGEDTRTRRQSLFGPRIPPEFANRVEGRNSLSRGNDQFVNSGDARARRPSVAQIEIVNDREVEINLFNATVESAAAAILGDALGLRFVVSDAVSGSITIQTTGPIPKSALLDLFRAALDANRAKIEQDGEILKVVPGSSGNRTFRLVSRGPGDSSTIIVAPLKYISAGQMANLLEPLVDEGLNVVSDRSRNLILLSGERPQVEAAIDAFNLFDVDVLRGKSVALVRLKAANPDDVVEELQTIFEAREGGLLDGVIEFLPNSRLSSVLVITSRSRYLADAQRWIGELDRTASGNRRISQVYPLRNRSAEDIAPILDDLLGDIQAENSEEEGPRAASSGSRRSRVAADGSRNALIVRALRSEHEELQRLLLDLDSSPRQVLLEATIAEVTLNDQVSLGVRWFFQSGNFGSTFSDVASGSIGANFPGFSSLFSSANAEAALNALAGVTDVKVISSPTLTVLDNKEAILQIGDQVPIATRTAVDTTSTDAPVVATIEYRDTGIILKVRPQIGASGRVTLDISQEVSDVATTNSSGIDSPTIRQRQIETHVVLRDGATLALGGLVQENDSVTETKVPGLGDIPVVGAVFRSRSLSKERSELLILIRPRVIETDSDAEAITRYLRNKLSAANSILQVGLGAPRHTINDIFK